jgi:hypothetical protein
MGTGQLLLITQGEKDDALFKQMMPEATVFSPFHSIFRKHTPFATDTYRCEFKGYTRNPFGKQLVCDLPKDQGHLLSDLVLSITLEGTEINAMSPWGYAYINYVSLYFDDKEMDRIYSDWLFTYHALLLDKAHHSEQASMILANYATTTRSRTFYIRLPFWFVQEWTSALPLCALRNTTVSIRVSMTASRASVSSIQVLADTPARETVNVTDMALLTSVVWLGPDEFKKIRDAGHLRYTVLTTGYNVLNPIAANFDVSQDVRIQLGFKGRLVDIFWMLQSVSGTADNPFINAGVHRYSYWREFVPLVDQVSSAWFYVDGTSTVSLPGMYYRSTVPMCHYDGNAVFYMRSVDEETTVLLQGYAAGTGIYAHTWALYPLHAHSQPSGFFNSSKCNSVELRLRVTPSTVARNAMVFARMMNILEIKGGHAGFIMD